MQNIIKNNRGATGILLTMLILSSVLVVTLTISEIVRTGLIMGRTQIHSTKAFFASEAGAERLLWEIRKDSLDPTPTGLNCDPTGDYFCFLIATGDINSCNDPCPALEIETQTLSNGADYNLIYEYDVGPPATTILTSYGSYDDVRRAVELRY